MRETEATEETCQTLLATLERKQVPDDGTYNGSLCYDSQSASHAQLPLATVTPPGFFFEIFSIGNLEFQCSFKYLACATLNSEALAWATLNSEARSMRWTAHEQLHWQNSKHQNTSHMERESN